MPWSLAIFAYLVGSLPAAYLVTRAWLDIDVRQLGSGNVGATNVLRNAGCLPGGLVLLLDIGKGAVPVLIGLALDVPDPVLAATAVAAVMGHVLPCFLSFRGGKGVATATGAFSLLAPRAIALAAMVFFVVVAWKRYVSLGSIAAAASLPVFLEAGHAAGWPTSGSHWFTAAAALVAAIMIHAHRSNMARLLVGVEAKIGGSRREETT